MAKTIDKYLYSETAAVQDVYTRKIVQLSPSVKLVFKVLEYKGLLAQKELVAESYLPPRTVRCALSRLKNHRERRGHREKIINLCALCVLRG